MLILYMRSSSYNTFDFCQHKYFLQYVLGWQELTNKAACKGTIVHKAIELVAQRKLAKLNNETSFYDDGLDQTYDIDVNEDEFLFSAFDFYRKLENHLKFEKADLRECHKWFHVVLDDEHYSPLKRSILAAEQYFDIPIKEDWAEYKYLVQGKEVTGRLHIKGTVDLIYNLDHGIEYVDWKTGQRKNWATGKSKELNDFYHDPQLLLYHYALRTLFPEIDFMMFTVYYIKDGGPYTVSFDRRNIDKSLNMIKERFKEIKTTNIPETIWGDWKCSKLCGFGKNLWPGTNQTMCQFIHNKLKKHGVNKVTDFYINKQAMNAYTGGGKEVNKHD